MDVRLPSSRALEAFISAAETLSFTTAANRLNITSSAVSHRIMALEEEIGVNLFNRDGKKISLTKEGEDYYSQISPLIDSIKVSTHGINRSVRDNIISISSFQLFTENWLSSKIDGFLQLYPAANIEFRTLRLRRVTDPDITIKIIREGEERMGFEKLFDWKIVPACHRKLIAERQIKSPSDLVNAHLIETISARDVWPLWLSRAGLKGLRFTKTIIVDSASLHVNLIKRGIGVGMVADFMLPSLEEEEVVAPFEIRNRYPGGIYINRYNKNERPIVASFRDWLFSQSML